MRAISHSKVASWLSQLEERWDQDWLYELEGGVPSPSLRPPSSTVFRARCRAEGTRSYRPTSREKNLRGEQVTALAEARARTRISVLYLEAHGLGKLTTKSNSETLHRTTT